MWGLVPLQEEQTLRLALSLSDEDKLRMWPYASQKEDLLTRN